MAMCRLRSRRAPVCRAATAGGLPHRIDTAFGQCARSQGRGRAKLGGQIVEKGEEFWRKLREHELGFFAGCTPHSGVCPFRPPPRRSSCRACGFTTGAERSAGCAPARRPARSFALRSKPPGTPPCSAVATAVGSVSQPLPPALAAMHHRLKQALDPAGVLNFGRTGYKFAPAS